MRSIRFDLNRIAIRIASDCINSTVDGECVVSLKSPPIRRSSCCENESFPAGVELDSVRDRASKVNMLFSCSAKNGNT